MSDAAEVGITITAQDNTGPGLASVTKGVEGLEKKFNGLGGALKTMPEKFSKVSAVMSTAGGDMGKLGQAVTGAMRKFSALASMIAIGGPLGIAMAAVTVAFTIYAKIVDDTAEKVKKLEEAEKKRADALAKVSEAFWAEQEKKERDNQKSRDKQMSDIEKDIRLRQLRDEVLKKIHDEEMKRQQEEKKGEQERFQQQTEAYESRMQHEQDLRDFKQENAESEAAYAEAVAEEEAEKDAARREAAQKGIELSNMATSVFLANTEKERKAAIKAAIGAALDRIAVYAAEGAAGAALQASASYPPPYGQIIGAVAAAAVYTAIMAFKAKVVGAATGGLITGGTPGKDSVPAMLTPGEVVIRAPVVQKIERMAEGGGGMGGTTIVQNHNYSMLDASQLSHTTRRRNAKTMGNDIEELSLRGMVRRANRR